MNLTNYILYPLITHPLNKRAKIKALCNFIYWQLRLRFAYPYELIVPFTKNSKFIVKKGRSGLTGNLYCGLHEFEDMMFLLHFLRTEDLFFDIGSNAGSYSILSNTHVGAKTTSFEPLPNTVELLKNNKAINGDSASWNIEMLALGDNNDCLWFTSDRDTMNQIVSASYLGNKIQVNVVSLDWYCEKHQLVPNLIKVDAEGFDENVVRGGQLTLLDNRVKALIIESDTEVVKNILLKSGFEPYIYEPFSRTLTKGFSIGCNQLYIKDPEFINNRIKTAEKVVIKDKSI